MEVDQITKSVVAGIFQFLEEELNKSTTTSKQKESLEITKQCLATAFKMDVGDPQFRPKIMLRLLVAARLDEVGDAEASEEDKESAEFWKQMGNAAMNRLKLQEALDCYNMAISYDSKNAAIFCNRAATYLKLGWTEEAVKDCEVAIQLKPSYAKAFSRMGFAYSERHKYADATLCYQKAVELDPENGSYHENLRVAQAQHIAMKRKNFNLEEFLASWRLQMQSIIYLSDAQTMFSER
ncbi:unnamed protein product [Orchesella dallaii]|uniref:SGTA homodimerisation domain-containing protein n=1 Tax=Orchesella dallaii TaxID=48710 RepID=A0ABP1PI07_9HEXA